MAEAQLLGGTRPLAATVPESQFRTVTLAVENMNCGGCMGKIERALTAQRVVAAARANLSTKRVTVTFEPARISVEKLLASLKRRASPPRNSSPPTWAPRRSSTATSSGDSALPALRQ
jgi:Cu2+-exporting ATPase